MNAKVRTSMTAFVLAGFALAAGCSPPAPEERLTEAGSDVTDTRDRIAAINAEIDRHQSAIQNLRKERQNARAALETLEERLERRATDLAIFRAAQSALLNDPLLEDSVVVANVDDGVVTLEGTVSSAEKEQKAAEIIGGIPGVDSTVNRLQLVDDGDGSANDESSGDADAR